MTIGIGQHGADSSGFADSITTAAVDTNASGSSFLIGYAGGLVPSSESDNKSNAYSVVQQLTVGSGPVAYVSLFLAANGAGGVGHDATCNFASDGTVADWLIEITGGADSPLDQSGTSTGSSGPYLGPTGIVTSVANELAIFLAIATYNGQSCTFSESTGFTLEDAVTAAGNPCVWGFKSIASSGTTVQPSLTVTTTGSAPTVGIIVATFLPAGSMSLAQWNIGILGDYQRRMITAPLTLSSAVFAAPGVLAEPAGTVVNIYPVTVGTSGSFTITDNGAEVFTMPIADIVAGVPIPVRITCMHDITVSSVPAGGEYGVLWEGIRS